MGYKLSSYQLVSCLLLLKIISFPALISPHAQSSILLIRSTGGRHLPLPDSKGRELASIPCITKGAATCGASQGTRDTADDKREPVT